MFPKIRIIIPIGYLFLLQLLQLQFAHAILEGNANMAQYEENQKFVFLVDFAVPTHRLHETSISTFISPTIAFTQKYPSQCYEDHITTNVKHYLKEIKYIAFHVVDAMLPIPFEKNEFTLIPVSEDLLIIRLLETHHRLEEHIFISIEMSKDPITADNIEDFLFYFYSFDGSSVSIEQGYLYLNGRIMLFPANKTEFRRHLGGPLIAFNKKDAKVSVIGVLSGCMEKLNAFMVEFLHLYYSIIMNGLMDSNSEYASFAQSSIPISQQSGHKELKFRAPVAFDVAVRSSVYVGQRILLSFIPTKHVLGANCFTFFFNALDVNAGMVIIKFSDGGIYYYLDQSDAMVAIVVPKFVEDTKYIIKALLSDAIEDIARQSYLYATNADFEAKTVSVDLYPIDIQKSLNDGSLKIGEKILYQRDIGSAVGFENGGTVVVTAMVRRAGDGSNLIQIVLTHYFEKSVSYFIKASDEYQNHISSKEASEFFQKFKANPGNVPCYERVYLFLTAFLNKISSRTDDPRWKSFDSTTLYQDADKLLRTLKELERPYIIPAELEPQVDTILKFFF